MQGSHHEACRVASKLTRPSWQSRNTYFFGHRLIVFSLEVGQALS
jgi:hypothetical protein